MKEPKIEYRTFDNGDNIEELTILLNAAYKKLADLGFNYTASYQDSIETLRRIQKGTCLIALKENIIIGTILYYSSKDLKGSPWYEKDNVVGIGQFAVSPEHQRSGIGEQLLIIAEEIARKENAEEIALDTSEGAEHLILYYEKKGYRVVENVQWEGKTYRSVIMSKKL